MFRVFNEYLKYIHLSADPEVECAFNHYLADCKGLKSYCVTIHYNRLVVDVKLADFSLEKAQTQFQRMIGKVGYPYSQMFVRFNEGTVVRYRYASCKEKDHIRLQPENDAMDPIIVKDVTILGRVIGLYRQF